MNLDELNRSINEEHKYQFPIGLHVFKSSYKQSTIHDV